MSSAPVFLDRDGTVIDEVGYLCRPEQVALLPGAACAIRLLNRAKRPAILVTNQPVIAMELCTDKELARIHAVLEAQLAGEGARLDAIYYCPHDPQARGERGIAALQIDCDCRKPKDGLIRRAAGELGLDLSDAWMIGDKTADIQTARNAGLRSILVRTGYGGRDGAYAAPSDYICASLQEAVALILLTDKPD